MFYLTSDGSGPKIDPLTAIISPRPIAWITSKSADGNVNLSPYSFFTAVAYAPPQIVISSVGTKPDRGSLGQLRQHPRDRNVLHQHCGFEDREALNASSASSRAR